MFPNPYESPRDKGSTGKGGPRLTTIAVFAMLAVLILTCAALVVVAYWIQGLR